MLGWHDVAYGRHAWALPRVARPHPEQDVRTAVFAAALLSGGVLPAMAALAPALAAQPATAARPELKGLPRVGELLGALRGRGVDSRAALAAAWQAQPQFLQPQLAAWLQKPHRSQLARLWPKLLQQAGEQRGTRAGKGGKKRGR